MQTNIAMKFANM